MDILVVAQNKGGDGKTTSCKLLAEYFARRKKRVLLIDLDPQCNLSQRFLRMALDNSEDGVSPPVHPDFDENDPDFKDWNGISSAADMFYGRTMFPYPTKVDGVDILPGWGRDLRKVEMVAEEQVKERVHNVIHQFLSREEVRDEYDLVIIDTAPSKGPLTQAAMRAADFVVIPCQMEQQSKEGLRGMVGLVRDENRKRTPDRELKIVGILPNKFRRRTTLQEGIHDSLRDDPVLNAFLIPYELTLRTAFSENDHPGVVPRSIFDLDKKDPARMEVEAVCKYIDGVMSRKRPPVKSAEEVGDQGIVEVISHGN